MYAAEALLILGRPKQAMDYLKENNKEFKIRCHSTLASNAAVFTEDISIRGIQLLNQASVLL